MSFIHCYRSHSLGSTRTNGGRFFLGDDYNRAEERDVTSSGRRYGKEREERLNEPPTGDLPVRILYTYTYK
jgi:hypothetical protein